MKITLVAHPGGVFEVREMDDFGNQRQLSWAPDLGSCLTQAAQVIGRPLILTIHGPQTDLPEKRMTLLHTAHSAGDGNG